MDFVSFILKLDRRIIYTIVGLLVFIPLVKPLKLPIVPTNEVKGIYNFVDTLPAGSHVLVSADFDPASKPELQPMLEAFLAHCFIKDLKVHLLTLWPSGPGLAQTSLEKVAQKYGKQAGTDFCFLGYRAGNFAVVLGMNSDIPSTFNTDWYGTPTRTMPIYQEVSRTGQMKYILDIAAGATVEMWIAYAAESQGVPIGAAVTAVSATQYYPYVQAGQINGLSGGMKGTAEYETLVMNEYGKDGPGWQALSTKLGNPSFEIPPGDATKGMDAQSAVHLFIVFSIIVANICYFISLKRERELRRAGR